MHPVEKSAQAISSLQSWMGFGRPGALSDDAREYLGEPPRCVERVERVEFVRVILWVQQVEWVGNVVYVDIMQAICSVKQHLKGVSVQIVRYVHYVRMQFRYTFRPGIKDLELH